MLKPTPTLVAVLIVSVAVGSAKGGDVPGFTYAEACRIDDTSVVVRIVYQGGSCETTAELEPRVELNGTSAAVIIPSKETSDTCIMQIVPNDVQKTLGIASDTTELDITLLDPQLQPQGHETVVIQPHSADCRLPGEGGF